MLSYLVLFLTILSNLVLYCIFSVYYDFLKIYPQIITQSEKTEGNSSENHKPPAWKNSFDMIITLIPSLIFWVIFTFSPALLLVLQDSYITNKFIIIIDNYWSLIQITGLILISLGTAIAFLGRKARGVYSISWGIPEKLITFGIFKYIRHPLYTSYCLYFVGYFLVFPSIFTLILIPGIFGYYRSSIYEESILKKNYEEYSFYCKNTGRFLPKIRKKNEQS